MNDFKIGINKKVSDCQSVWVTKSGCRTQRSPCLILLPSSLGPVHCWCWLPAEAYIKTREEGMGCVCSLPACPPLVSTSISSPALKSTSLGFHHIQRPAETPSLISVSNYQIFVLSIHNQSAVYKSFQKIIIYISELAQQSWKALPSRDESFPLVAERVSPFPHKDKIKQVNLMLV